MLYAALWFYNVWFPSILLHHLVLLICFTLALCRNGTIYLILTLICDISCCPIFSIILSFISENLQCYLLYYIPWIISSLFSYPLFPPNIEKEEEKHVLLYRQSYTSKFLISRFKGMIFFIYHEACSLACQASTEIKSSSCGMCMC